MVRSTCPMCNTGFTQVKRSDEGEPIDICSTEEQEIGVPARRSSRLKRKRDERKDVMRGYVNGRIRSLVNRLEASTHLKRIAKWSSSVKTKKKNSNIAEQTNSDTKVKMKKKKTPQSQSAITTSQLLSENERLRRRLEKLKKKKRKKKRKKKMKRMTKDAVT